MFYAILAAFAAVIVILDQVVKYLVVQNIPLGGMVPVWPGVIHLTYVKNTGMSFSLLEGQRWFFVVVTLVILAAMVVAVRKKWVRHPMGLWALAAIAGGAVGNFMDRLLLGYVIDMFEVEFIRFAVFNVADSFLVCGTIVLVIYALFFDRPKEDTGHGADG